MPLINHCQIKQYSVRLNDSIEVLLAIVKPRELRPVQLGRATPLLHVGQVRKVYCSPITLHATVEEFHADDGVDVIQYL